MPNKVEINLGERIKIAWQLVNAGGNGEGITGISKSQIYRYIKNEQSPSFANMVSLAKHSGVALDWLASGVGERFNSSQKEQDDDLDFMSPEYLQSVKVSLDLMMSVGEPLLDTWRANDQISNKELMNAFIAMCIQFKDQGSNIDQSNVVNFLEMARLANKAQ